MRVLLLLVASLASLVATSRADEPSFLAAPLLGQIKIPSPPKIPTIPQIPVPPSIPRAPVVPDPFETKAWRRASNVEEPTYREFEREELPPERESLEETIAKLLEEFGPNARYGVTEHFVFIFDSTNVFAQWVALICERVETTYEKFVQAMRIGQTDLDEPMVVLIFTNKQDYEAFAAKDFAEYASLKNKPVGFYSSGKNRVALYDLTETDKKKVDDLNRKRSLEEVSTEILSQPQGMETLSVIVHETTHMVSYNRGLFGRTGKNPQWAVEGLAMLFEAPVGEVKDGGWNATTHFEANRNRIREFQRYANTTTENPLRRIIASETINGDVEGSYEISWALFSYLYKKYPGRLARYLRATAGTQPRPSYPVNERVAEFEACFTSDYDKLYKELRAFVDEIEKNPETFAPTPRRENEEGEKGKTKKEKREDKPKEPEGEVAKQDDEKEDSPKEDKTVENREKDSKKTSENADQPQETQKSPQSERVDKGAEPSKPDSEPEKPKTPTISLEGVAIDGSVFDWGKYSGKYALVCFWATWSKASVEEIDRLVVLYDKYRDEGLEIVGYSLDDDLDTLKKFVADHNVGWTTLSQALSNEKKIENMADRFGVYSTPKTILVGKNGETLDTNVRADELDEKLRSLFPEK